MPVYEVEVVQTSIVTLTVQADDPGWAESIATDEAFNFDADSVDTIATVVRELTVDEALENPEEIIGA